MTDLEYEKLSDKTLDHLSEVFENIFDSGDFSDIDNDITYSNGVLTVNLGPKLGTYVINKQTPNKQIWLSSPVSGPKRYDYMNGTWLYKYDRMSLNQLLHQEFSKMFKKDFKQFFFDLNDN
uniref:ferroxidase n=1 Tax=Helobdella robusta TaxID=6412 RepID=T1FXN1_HELRO